MLSRTAFDLFLITVDSFLTFTFHKVATFSMLGGMFKHICCKCTAESDSKTFRKSVNIWRSYG